MLHHQDLELDYLTEPTGWTMDSLKNLSLQGEDHVKIKLGEEKKKKIKKKKNLSLGGKTGAGVGGSQSTRSMPGSGAPREEGRTGGIILTKKLFTGPKAARSSRSMWGRLVGKWMQLFSDLMLAATPARKIRQ